MQFINLNRATSDFGESIYTQTGISYRFYYIYIYYELSILPYILIYMIGYLGGSRDQPGVIEILLQILWYGGLLQASTRNAANFYGTILIVLFTFFTIGGLSYYLYFKVIKCVNNDPSRSDVVYLELPQKEC